VSERKEEGRVSLVVLSPPKMWKKEEGRGEAGLKLIANFLEADRKSVV
jgi:hypothetical protein